MKLIIKRSINTLAVAGVLIQTSLMFSVEAEIFKCTNKQGAVYYNDRPCPVIDDEKKIRSEKDVVNGYIPPEFKQANKERRAGVVVGGDSIQTNNEQLERDDKSPESNGKGSSSNSGSTSNSSSHGSGGTLSAKKKSVQSKKPKLPSKAKLPIRAADGKFTIQEKRAMLGIFPAER